MIKKFSIDKFFNDKMCGVEAIDELLLEIYERLDGKEFQYIEYKGSKNKQRKSGYYPVTQISGSLRHFVAKEKWLN